LGREKGRVDLHTRGKKRIKKRGRGKTSGEQSFLFLGLARRKRGGGGEKKKEKKHSAKLAGVGREGRWGSKENEKHPLGYFVLPGN